MTDDDVVLLNSRLTVDKKTKTVVLAMDYSGDFNQFEDDAITAMVLFGEWFVVEANKKHIDPAVFISTIHEVLEHGEILE